MGFPFLGVQARRCPVYGAAAVYSMSKRHAMGFFSGGQIHI